MYLANEVTLEVEVPNGGEVFVTYTRTTRSGSCTCAGGRKKSVSITPKIAVFAPIPSAKQATTAALNPGLRARVRSA